MSALGFSLVLTAAFCHALWNFFVKRINAGPELVFLFSLVAMIIYLPAAVVVAVRSPMLDARQLALVAASAGLHLCYFLLLQRGYRTGNLSVVYPTARATGPLVSVSFAVLVLGERLSPLAALGGVIVVTGVLMLSGGIRLGDRGALPSLAFGVAVGILIGSYTVLDAFAVSTLLVPPLLLDYASSVGRVVLLAPLACRRRAAVRTLWTAHRWRVVAIAVFNPLAYILVLVALTFTPVIYVAPTRELSVLIAVMLGSLLLGEGDLVRRLKCVAIILAGVVVLGVGSA